MKTTQTVLAGWPAELQRLHKLVKRIVKEVYPECTEKPAWAGIGFKDSKNYTVITYPSKDGLNVMIMRGVMLNDSQGLLDGRDKNARNFRIKTSDFNAEYLKNLLEEQRDLFKSGVTWE